VLGTHQQAAKLPRPSIGSFDNPAADVTSQFASIFVAQWQRIEPVFPKPKRRRDKRGRPPASNRACFEGILWILQTGAAWRFLPDTFPSPSTCWRRLK